MGFTFEGSTKSSTAPEFEDGIVDAKFLGISEKYIEGGAYGGGERLEWAFAPLDDEGEEFYENGDPLELSGLTSKNMNVSSDKAKAPKWLKALTTKDEWLDFVDFAESGGERGAAISAEELVGRICQIEVSHNKNGWPTVANVLPKRQRRAARRTAAEGDEE